VIDFRENALNALHPSLRNDSFVSFVAGILVAALMLVGGPTAYAAAHAHGAAKVGLPGVAFSCFADTQPSPPIPTSSQMRAMQETLAVGWGVAGNSPVLALSQDELSAACVTPTMQANELVWHEISVIDSADLPGWTIAASGLMSTSAAEVHVSYSVVLLMLNDNPSAELLAAIRTSWTITNPTGTQQATILAPLAVDTAWTADDWAFVLESPYRSHRTNTMTGWPQTLQGCNDTYNLCMDSAKNTYDRKKALCYAGAAVGAGASAACGFLFLICLIPIATLLERVMDFDPSAR
jgi:hypothetical protein